MQQQPQFAPHDTEFTTPDTPTPPAGGDHAYRTRQIGPPDGPPTATGAQAMVEATFGAFITPVVASVLYVLLMLLGGVAAGWLIFNSDLAEEPVTRMLVVLPAYVLALLLVRILLESIVVLFRIEEHLRAMRNGR